jgi:hypothetical protein
MPNNIPEYSSIAVICIFLIKEMFSYLKAKKNNTSNGYERELGCINEKLGNHIVHFTKDLEDVRDKVGEIENELYNIKVELVKITARLKKD